MVERGSKNSKEQGEKPESKKAKEVLGNKTAEHAIPQTGYLRKKDQLTPKKDSQDAEKKQKTIPEIIKDVSLNDAQLPVLLEFGASRVVKERITEYAAEDLGSLTEFLTGGIRREEDPFWYSDRKKGATIVYKLVQTEKENRWHDRVVTLATQEKKTNAEIAKILMEEGYTTGSEKPISPDAVNTLLSRKRKAGEEIPKREIAWHTRAKEIAHLSPAERERILAEEGYTTRDGNPISANRINVYLSGERKKGKSLPTSGSLWHDRALQLATEEKRSNAEIVEILGAEGFTTTHGTSVSPERLSVFFSQKRKEGEEIEREILWHDRVKELSHLPPEERAKILTDEGYTTRYGKPISGQATSNFLANERRKGESLAASKITPAWQKRADELQAAGNSTSQIARILGEEGYKSHRNNAISRAVVYNYFYLKANEEGESS